MPKRASSSSSSGPAPASPSEKKVKQTTEVWLLVITKGIDDYKTRGESPSSKVYVFDDEWKCRGKLYTIILDAVVDKLNSYIKDRREDETLKRMGLAKYFKRDKQGKWSAKPCGIYKVYDEWYDWVSEGEYI